MSCDEWIRSILDQYHMINVLSNKNGAMVMRVRHTALEKDMILRRYTQAAYAEPYKTSAP